MDRKELIEILMDNAEDRLRVVWQKKPYTMVEVQAEYNDEWYYDFAFAKVRHPDPWDAEYGVELATRKACASIAKRILNGEIGD